MSDTDLARTINQYANWLIKDPDTRLAWPWVPIGRMIIEESRRRLGPVHNYPVSLGCALVEGESWFRNIFGCDWGSKWTNVPPYCQVYVTEERVKKLIANVQRQAGLGQNGIGLTQLTSMELVMRAEDMGGAHIMRNQLVVGFDYLADLIDSYGYFGGVGAYNAGPGNRNSVRWTYTANLEARHNAWIRRLT